MSQREVEGFATHLRFIKERSGRSFEAIAKRAGISRSAVHRYCSGKGLPTDFGTAERIARVCGASSAELLELHRRWIRADAAQAVARDGSDEAAAYEAGGADGTEDMTRPGPPGSALGIADTPTEAVTSPESHQGEPSKARRDSRWRRGSRWRHGLLLAIGGTIVAAAAATTATVAILGVSGPADPPGNQGLLLSDACPAVISLGQHSECVRELQRLLVQAGGVLKVDADFGLGTLRQVVAVQVTTGLPVTGQVDASLKRALYAGEVKLRRWPQSRIEARIREVFPEEPDRAVGIARCMSFLDPYYSLVNVNGSRNWGVFQISDRRLSELGGTPLKAFDPEWNIQAARTLWRQNRDFRHWENCDQPYRDRTATPRATGSG